MMMSVSTLMTRIKDFWKNGIIVGLTNPYYLLYIALFGVLYLELGHVILDEFAIRGQPLGDRTEQFLSTLFEAGVTFTLLAGAISIVYRLIGQQPGATPSESTIKQRITGYGSNPFKLLTIGFYVTTLIGLGSIAIATWESRDRGPMRAWRGWSDESFAVLSSILLLAAIVSIVAALRKPAPSGAAEDVDKTEANERPESPSDAEESGGWWSATKALVEDDHRRLIFGLYVIAIIGMLNLTIDMALAVDSATSTIWLRFFGDLFPIAVNVGYLLVAIRILGWINKTDKPTEISSNSGPVQRAVSYLGDLRGGLTFAVLAIASTGAVWFMVSMWIARNAGGAAFWRLISFDALVLLGALAPVLVLWAAWDLHVLKTNRVNIPEFLREPYSLLKRLLYVIVYVGVLSTVLLLWLERPAGPSRIWADMFHMLGLVATPVAILVGARAIYLVTTGQFVMPSPTTSAESASTETATATETAATD